MSKLRSRALRMAGDSDEGYIRDGLVLYLDGEDDLVRNVPTDLGNATVWSDRAVLGQKAATAALTHTENAMLFNGTNSRCRIDPTEEISLSGVLSGLKDRTIEIVCKLNNTESVQTVFLGKGNATSTEDKLGVGLWYRPASGGMKVSTISNQQSSVVSAESVLERASYSVIYGEKNINDYTLYQNGVECVKGEAAGNMNNPTYTTIGSRYYSDSYSYFMNGEINCIRVYDRKLTDAEREHNLTIDRRRFDF